MVKHAFQASDGLQRNIEDQDRSGAIRTNGVSLRRYPWSYQSAGL